MDCRRATSWASTRSSCGARTSSAPEQMPFKTAAGELYDTGEFARVMDTCLKKADWAGFAGADGRRRRPAAGCAASACATTSNRPWATRASTRRSSSSEDGTVSVAGRHPDQRPGPRHRLRPGAAQPPGRAVREDPHRPGRHRPDQGGRRHRRLALADRAGHGDQRRLRPGDRARQDVRGAGVRDRGGRHRVPATARSASPAPIGAIGILELAGQGARPWPPAWAWRAASTPRPPPSSAPGRFPNGCHIAEVEVDPDTGTVRHRQLQHRSTISAWC